MNFHYGRHAVDVTYEYTLRRRTSCVLCSSLCMHLYNVVSTRPFVSRVCARTPGKIKCSTFSVRRRYGPFHGNPKRAIIRLQHQISVAQDWFDRWRLQTNAQKSIAILFNRKRSARPPGVILQGI